MFEITSINIRLDHLVITVHTDGSFDSNDSHELVIGSVFNSSFAKIINRQTIEYHFENGKVPAVKGYVLSEDTSLPNFVVLEAKMRNATKRCVLPLVSGSVYLYLAPEPPISPTRQVAFDLTGVVTFATPVGNTSTINIPPRNLRLPPLNVRPPTTRLQPRKLDFSSSEITTGMAWAVDIVAPANIDLLNRLSELFENETKGKDDVLETVDDSELIYLPFKTVPWLTRLRKIYLYVSRTNPGIWTGAPGVLRTIGHILNCPMPKTPPPTGPTTAVLTFKEADSLADRIVTLLNDYESKSSTVNEGVQITVNLINQVKVLIELSNGLHVDIPPLQSSVVQLIDQFEKWLGGVVVPKLFSRALDLLQMFMLRYRKGVLRNIRANLARKPPVETKFPISVSMNATPARTSFWETCIGDENVCDVETLAYELVTLSAKNREQEVDQDKIALIDTPSMFGSNHPPNTTERCFYENIRYVASMIEQIIGTSDAKTEIEKKGKWHSCFVTDYVTNNRTVSMVEVTKNQFQGMLMSRFGPAAYCIPRMAAVCTLDGKARSPNFFSWFSPDPNKLNDQPQNDVTELKNEEEKAAKSTLLSLFENAVSENDKDNQMVAIVRFSTSGPCFLVAGFAKYDKDLGSVDTSQSRIECCPNGYKFTKEELNTDINGRVLAPRSTVEALIVEFAKRHNLSLPKIDVFIGSRDHTDNLWRNINMASEGVAACLSHLVSIT